jgi:hypothetical protein
MDFYKSKQFWNLNIFLIQNIWKSVDVLNPNNYEIWTFFVSGHFFKSEHVFSKIYTYFKSIFIGFNKSEKNKLKMNRRTNTVAKDLTGPATWHFVQALRTQQALNRVDL